MDNGRGPGSNLGRNQAMSVAQTRAAARKMKLRYGEARRLRSVAEAMAEEKRKAERSIAASKKK